MSRMVKTLNAICSDITGGNDEGSKEPFWKKLAVKAKK